MRVKIHELLFFLCIFIFIYLKFIPFIHAAPSMTEGPFIVNPPWSIGAPNDNVEFILNITESEISIDNVLLLYSIKNIDEIAPMQEEEYEPISMIVKSEVASKRSWYCKLIPKENKKVIYFYCKITDSLGNVFYHPDIENPQRFRILKPDPEFKIVFFTIESIDEKQLTAIITFSVDIKAGYDSPTVSLFLNDEHLTVERIDRFHFFEQKTIRNLPLSGDPTHFPFDDYFLNVEFRAFFENEPEELIENIMISDFNDRAIWMHSYDIEIEKNVMSSQITINNNLKRKIENAYIFIIPTLICSLFLGGSYLISNDQDGISKRIPIHIGVFVFIIGSNVIQVLRDMIPSMAIGITSAELTLIWLSCYSGIFLLFSLFGYYYRDKKYKGISYYIIIDIISIFFVLVLYFKLPIVNINLPYISKTYSLWDHISYLPFKIALIFSLIYGCIINLYNAINRKKESMLDVI